MSDAQVKEVMDLTSVFLCICAAVLMLKMLVLAIAVVVFTRPDHVFVAFTALRTVSYRNRRPDLP